VDRSLRSLLGLLLVVILLVGTTGCIAGTGKYSEEHRANFWVGLFNGLISPITLLISLFTGAISMYEVHNVGWGYNAGFLLGIAIILGGGCRPRKTIRAFSKRSRAKHDWDAFGEELGREIREGIRARFDDAEAAEPDDESWRQIARKVEDKVKRRLKDWAEKD
jgi:hypothetical protein